MAKNAAQLVTLTEVDIRRRMVPQRLVGLLRCAEGLEQKEGRQGTRFEFRSRTNSHAAPPDEILPMIRTINLS